MPCGSKQGIRLVNKSPGPMTITSDFFKRSSASLCAFERGYSEREIILPILLSLSIIDSPCNVLPFSYLAKRLVFFRVTGYISPFTLSILLANVITLLYDGAIVSRTVRNTLPKLCPLKSPRSNLYKNNSLQISSDSERATKHCRKSPGGNTPY